MKTKTTLRTWIHDVFKLFTEFTKQKNAILITKDGKQKWLKCGNNLKLQCKQETFEVSYRKTKITKLVI